MESVQNILDNSALRQELQSQLTFDVQEVFDLLENHNEFVAKYAQQFISSISSGTIPEASAIAALNDLISQSEIVSAKLRGSYTNGNIVKLADTINYLADSYQMLQANFIFQGKASEAGFSERYSYNLYTIPYGFSLSQVAESQLGSRDLTSILLEDNPELRTMSAEDIWLKTIKIRDNNHEKASLSSNVGEDSLGSDLPDDLTIMNGDLSVLKGNELLIQGVLNIFKYGTSSVPEDPNFGNNLMTSIGSDKLSVSPAVSVQLLKDALLQDSSISEVEVENLSFDEDAVHADLTIVPANTNEPLTIKV